MAATQRAGARLGLSLAAGVLALVAAAPAEAQGRALKNCYEDIGCPWKYVLKAEDLDKLSCQNLAFVRNRIYYENGLCFRTPKVKKEFGNEGCKWPLAVLAPLNRFEHANVALIRKAEAKKKCPT